MVPAQRRRRWPTVLAWIAGVLCLLVIVGTITGLWLSRRSFPQTDGSVQVPGLGDRVEVLRDEHGVPQVYASSTADLFFAQGYVHAQDRFWEMDFRRHVTSGRLAELFGPDQVETDEFIRTLGWRRVAERELELLDDETIAVLEAYADGVNAYIDDRSKTELSFEYAILSLTNRGYEVEPWTPADSVAWLKAMAWDLRGNMQEEIERTLIAAEVGVDRTEQLYPEYPFDEHQPIVTSGAVVAGAFDQDAEGAPMPRAARATLAALARDMAELPVSVGKPGDGIGSNSWVLDGSMTTTGEPLLANDPHLGPLMPSIWYQMGLHCTEVTRACPYDVAGFTFSGLPGVVIGHNADIAWGFTNLGPDVSDLYLEKVDGSTYDVDGAPRPLRTREEVIEVAGGDPVTITVRETMHGPLISDVSDEQEDVGDEAIVSPGSPSRGDGYAVSLAWTALQPGRTADAIRLLNLADDWDEMREAAALFEVPAQNIVFADRDGTIGYQAPGRVPIRGEGDGRWPAPGWDSSYDWEGFIPFDELPSVRDPADGYVVTANNAVVGPDYPYLLTADWSWGSRSQRIVDLIEDADGDLSPADMAGIQSDTWNEIGSILTPYLLDLEIEDADATRARRLLEDWDHTQPADSSPAAYFNGVWRSLLRLAFDDELPKDHEASGGDRWFGVVETLLEEPRADWWDDVTTEGRETRDDILESAMSEGYDDVAGRLGDDVDDWEWGELHTLELENATFGTSGIAPIEWLFNRGPVEVGGGKAIVDANGWTAPDGYEVDWVPSMRMVVDLGDLDASRWVNLTGASGHAFHPNYWDQTELWRDGRTTAWPFSRTAVAAAAEDVLVMLPSDDDAAEDD